MTKFSWKCRRHEQIWVGGVGESTNFQIKLLCWLIDSLQNRIWCPRSLHFISLNVQTRALVSEKIWGIIIRHFPIKRHFDLIFPNFNKKANKRKYMKAEKFICANFFRRANNLPSEIYHAKSTGNYNNLGKFCFFWYNL